MHDFNILIWLGQKLSILSWVNVSTVHIASAGFVAVLLIILSIVANRKLRHIDKFVVPPRKFSIAGLFDVITEGILKLMEGVMGERAVKFLPVIGSVFIYIFVCNLLSLVPGFLPPTDNINTNLPCALTVFVYYHVMGIKEQGLKGYLKHFAGPIIWLAPLMFSLKAYFVVGSFVWQHYGRSYGAWNFFQFDPVCCASYFYVPWIICCIYPGICIFTFIDCLYNIGNRA